MGSRTVHLKENGICMEEMSKAPTPLGLFTDKMIAFFRDLKETYPEEKEIKAALDGLEAAKKVNPRLIHDLFNEHVYKPLHDQIMAEDVDKIIEYTKIAIQTQFNEIYPALSIFEKYWPEMSDSNRSAIWKHLKVLVLLCERASRNQ
jgi:hypothetical protein